MKIREIIEKIDKSRKNQSSIDIEELSRELGINYHGDFYDDTKEGARLKSYYMGYWYCTDSYVGYRAYFLDDVVVSISYQEGRKCDKEYFWVSIETATSVKQFIESLTTPCVNVGILDIDEDCGEGFSINYGSQLLTDTLIEKVTGEKVTVVEKWKNYDSIEDWKNVVIKRTNGSLEKVCLSTLLVPFNIVTE
jgi:hypothetical protein